jgi:hypothetical protein
LVKDSNSISLETTRIVEIGPENFLYCMWIVAQPTNSIFIIIPSAAIMIMDFLIMSLLTDGYAVAVRLSSRPGLWKAGRGKKTFPPGKVVVPLFT